MPTYLSPGVYTEEVPAGAVPIQGVSTSTLGMVGPTERGPAVGAQLVDQLGRVRAHLRRPLTRQTYFPQAVRGFFDNGGQLLYCARVVGGARAKEPRASPLPQAFPTATAARGGVAVLAADGWRRRRWWRAGGGWRWRCAGGWWWRASDRGRRSNGAGAGCRGPG